MTLDGEPERNEIVDETRTTENADGNATHETGRRSKPKSVEPKTYEWEVDWVYSISLIALHIYAVYAAYTAICGRVQVKTLLYGEYDDRGCL